MNIAKSLQGFRKIAAEDRQFQRMGCRPGWYLQFHYRGRLNSRLHSSQPWRKVALTVSGRRVNMTLTPAYLGGLAGVFLDREYDCAALLGFVPETILDLGANIGFGSIFLSAVFPGATIAAVEPDPRNIPALRKNLEANGIRAEIFEAAIGSAPGSLRLRYGEDPTCSSLENTTMHEHPSSVSVPVTTVPAILSRVGWPQIDLLKIDIEGGEEDLLSRDTGWLSQVRAIVMEIHPSTTPERIGSYLADCGFSLSRLGGTREPVYLATRTRTS